LPGEELRSILRRRGDVLVHCRGGLGGWPIAARLLIELGTSMGLHQYRSATPRPQRFDGLDRALDPLGRFYRHNAMHAGTTRMVLDEFGRCARCVKLSFWKPDA